jgi:hypothetical protein
MLDEKERRKDEVSDLLDTVTAYAKQETLGPLKGGLKAGVLGLAGAITLGIGLIIILVAVLRLLQTETTAFEGKWMSALPYLIVFVAALACIATALAFIKRIEFEQGEPRQ